jgi:hypothetical protein
MTITIGQGAPQPIAWWEQIRDEFGPTHVLVLDPKNYNWGTYQTEFLDMCDELGPQRVIVKQYASDVSLASAAAARGYATWGHTFDDFLANPNLGTYLSAWSLLGIDYAASQTSWDVLLATGKPVIGHIAETQTAYDTAISKGAIGVQCTSASIAPVSWWNTAQEPVEVVGVVVQTLPALTSASVGTATPPTTTGVIAAVLPALTAASTGSVAVPAFSGTVASVLPALTQAANASTAPPAVSGEVAAILPALTASAAGTVQDPAGVIGDVATTLPALTATIIGTVSGPAPAVEWPARLTLGVSIDALNLTATVPELTLEASW